MDWDRLASEKIDIQKEKFGMSEILWLKPMCDLPTHPAFSTEKSHW